MMTKSIKIYPVMVAVCMALVVSGPAFAGDVSEAASFPEVISPAASAQLDREAMIAELVQQWGGGYQLEATLNHVGDSKLLAVWDATSLDEINTILAGGTAPEGPLALGDTDADYVFTPVTPCRIVDTRSAGGMMSAGSTREFFVYGDASYMNLQGGDSGGCASPFGEPRGVMVNVTAVPSANGNLRAYPANETTPSAAIMSYRNGVNLSNAVAVKTYYSILCPGPAPGGCNRELEIYASSATHVVIDIMGYYNMPEATAVDNMLLNTTTSVPAGPNYSIESPACPAGWRLTGGGCNAQFAGDRVNVNSRPNVFTGTNAATRWVCQGYNDAGVPMNIDAIAVCSRTPGR